MCHDEKRTCENYAKDSLYLIKILVKMDRQWQRAWKWGYVACNWKISHCQWIKRHFQNENEKALSLLSRDFYEYYTSVVIIFTNTLSSFLRMNHHLRVKKARFKLFSLKSFFLSRVLFAFSIFIELLCSVIILHCCSEKLGE